MIERARRLGEGSIHRRSTRWLPARVVALGAAALLLLTACGFPSPSGNENRPTPIVRAAAPVAEPVATRPAPTATPASIPDGFPKSPLNFESLCQTIQSPPPDSTRSLTNPEKQSLINAIAFIAKSDLLKGSKCTESSFTTASGDQTYTTLDGRRFTLTGAVDKTQIAFESERPDGDTYLVSRDSLAGRPMVTTVSVFEGKPRQLNPNSTAVEKIDHISQYLKTPPKTFWQDFAQVSLDSRQSVVLLGTVPNSNCSIVLENYRAPISVYCVTPPPSLFFGSISPN